MISILLNVVRADWLTNSAYRFWLRKSQSGGDYMLFFLKILKSMLSARRNEDFIFSNFSMIDLKVNCNC